MNRVVALGCAAAASVALVACNTAPGDTGAPATSAPALTTAPSQSTQVAETAQQGAQLPETVSGYTDQARGELADEGVTEADVERVLEAARANEAGSHVEWDNSGHFELEFQDVDVDIRPDGTVIDVGR